MFWPLIIWGWGVLNTFVSWWLLHSVALSSGYSVTWIRRFGYLDWPSNMRAVFRCRSIPPRWHHCHIWSYEFLAVGMIISARQLYLGAHFRCLVALRRGSTNAVCPSGVDDGWAQAEILIIEVRPGEKCGKLLSWERWRFIWKLCTSVKIPWKCEVNLQKSI